MITIKKYKTTIQFSGTAKNIICFIIGHKWYYDRISVSKRANKTKVSQKRVCARCIAIQKLYTKNANND